jgi:hypothetical protein
MAALSDNKYDVYNWIIEVAKSCTTLKQSIQVNRLTQLFLTRYEDFDMYCDLSDQVWRESSMNKLDKQYQDFFKTFLIMG